MQLGWGEGMEKHGKRRGGERECEVERRWREPPSNAMHEWLRQHLELQVHLAIKHAFGTASGRHEPCSVYGPFVGIGAIPVLQGFSEARNDSRR